MTEDLKTHMIATIRGNWNELMAHIDKHCISHDIEPHDRVELVCEVFSEGMHRIMSAVAMNDELRAVDIRQLSEHRLRLPWLDAAEVLQQNAQTDPDIQVIVMESAEDVHNLLAEIFGERKLDS